MTLHTMQYIHQSTYGHVGGMHTARPIMAMDKGHVYGMENGRVDLSKPIFNVRDNRLYATEHHPDGVSSHALYQIKGDKIHTTEFHPNHVTTQHVFELHQGPAVRI